ncbi:efflux RND transporter periplasmic adaptor subunit [candidate division KSB1 bacterium]|nr:efflux RND transporter periplasmic adaptor subunit [candidate division KSB1 bacterium]
MRISKKKLFIFIGIFVVLAVFVFANLKKKGQKTKIQTETVSKGTITETVSGSARIQPEVQVKISAKVSGQIVDLGVKEGDSVTEGQFLAQLDQEYYQAAMEQTQSNLAFAEAGYTKAQNEYNRYKQLFEDNLTSEAELDLAKSNFGQAKAQVEQGEATLKQARDNLAKTTIYSPMDGTVSQLNKKLGEMAMGSQFTLDVIMVVSDLTQMQAETEIDENDVIHVTVDDTANIMIDAFPDTTFKGVVYEIANTGSTLGQGTMEQVTNFLVKVAMIEKPEHLRPGMSSTVDIITESKENVLKVPIQCVTIRKPVKEEVETTEETADSTKTDSTETKGKPKEEEKPVKVIFIVENNIAQQLEVETGISSDTEWEIKSGLEEGAEIVSGPYRILSKQLNDKDEISVDNSLKKDTSENES